MGSDTLKGSANLGFLIDAEAKIGLQQIALDRTTTDEPVRMSDIAREALHEYLVNHEDELSEAAVNRFPDGVLNGASE